MKVALYWWRKRTVGALHQFFALQLAHLVLIFLPQIVTLVQQNTCGSKTNKLKRVSCIDWILTPCTLSLHQICAIHLWYRWHFKLVVVQPSVICEWDANTSINVQTEKLMQAAQPTSLESCLSVCYTPDPYNHQTMSNAQSHSYSWPNLVIVPRYGIDPVNVLPNRPLQIIRMQVCGWMMSYRVRICESDE